MMLGHWLWVSAEYSIQCFDTAQLVARQSDCKISIPVILKMAFK